MLTSHWPEYLIEAAGTGIFMLSACLLGTLLGHPGSPVNAAIGRPLALRVLMGAAMGLTALGLVLSPWGKRSGAHFNPALTLTFYRLGKTGHFLCARAAIREFLRRGMQPDVSCALGKIICMSSVHEIIPWGGHANYAASKGGVGMLMRTLAQEYGPQHIRVNSINPGAIKTPINRAAWATPEAEQSLLTLIPYGRVGVVADIGKAAVWLASDDSDYVTGHTLYVDGGMTLYPGFSTNG